MQLNTNTLSNSLLIYMYHFKHWSGSYTKYLKGNTSKNRRKLFEKTKGNNIPDKNWII